MGLFGNNYNRPGPGVSKNEPKPNRFVLYWRLLGRKFWDIMKMNLMFFLPTVLVVLLCAYLTSAMPNGFLGSFLGGLPLVLLSPFYMGLTFVTRNFVREEHAFLWADYIEKAKENVKYAIMHGLITYIVYYLLSVAGNFYTSNMHKMGVVLTVIVLALTLLIFFLFTCMQFYIPLQIVTFDMPLRNIYKNAFIFSISNLPRNFVAFLIVLAVGLLLYIAFALGTVMLLFLLIGLVLAGLLAFAFLSYSVNFLVYPMVEKMMIKPELRRQAIANGTLSEEDPDFTDWDSVRDEDDDDDDDDDDE